MRKRIAIIHWMPIEMYPPAINIARHFADRGWEVIVHTTRTSHPIPAFTHRGVTVHRTPETSKGSAVRRAAASLSFQSVATARLVAERPDALLYFEPQSSFPVFLADHFRHVPLFIHHHEYHEPRQFNERGMRMARRFHALERRRLFARAAWVSHTNKERLAFFLEDNPAVPARVARVLPNLPPASWLGLPNHAWSHKPPLPLRMVYVGSLSLADTWLDALVTWVRSQREGVVTLDIFAYNLDADTRSYLDGRRDSRLRFHPDGIAYDDLPRVLRDYHAGVILYRGNTLNYRHNATNKLFEYLACGLDVIYQASMPGVRQFARSSELPRVIEVDFDHLRRLDLDVLSHRGGLPEGSTVATADDAIASLESEVYDAVAARGAGDSDRHR